jgi:uncharacterized membrane protein
MHLTAKPRRRIIMKDPLRIIKIRLAKGEISKEEYEELRNAIAS